MHVHGIQNIPSTVSLPVTTHSFATSQMYYVALASRINMYSSRGYVHIGSVSGLNLTNQQSIATRGASSISSFTSYGKLYLIIANDRDFNADGHSTYDLTVDIYVRSSITGLFQWFQSIPSYRAVHVTTYQVGKSLYMTITHYHLSVSIYRFALELGFQKIDEISVKGVNSVAPFKINNVRFMLVSSDSNNDVGPRVTTSYIYKLKAQGM